MSSFAALSSARQRSTNCHRQGGEREFISMSPLPSIPANTLTPSVGLITLFIYFIVPTYLPMLELVCMNRDPLPYPPQMSNGGSPPAHLSLSLDPPLMPPTCCNTNGCSLLHTLPTGWPANAILMSTLLMTARRPP
jgi:hypothetical protein